MSADSTSTDGPVAGSDLRLRLAKAFLRMLDSDRLSWEFRTFDDNRDRKDGRLTRTMRGSIEDKFLALRRLNASGAGVFVTINRTNGKGLSTEYVVAVTAIFADTDGADVQPLLKLKPHITVISSPGNYHCYWRAHDCHLLQFKAIQQATSAKFGTDPRVQDLPRVMRLPGFDHNKCDPVVVTFAPAFMDPGRSPYSTADVIAGLGLQLGLSEKGKGRLDGSAQEAADGDGRSSASDTLGTASQPPAVAEMRAMLQFLVGKEFYIQRSDEPRGAARDRWMRHGMALKAAYGDVVGLELWSLTHEDDRARADAPGQWKSFAANAQRGHVTVSTTINDARDAGYAFDTTVYSTSGDAEFQRECKSAFTRLAALSSVDYDRVRKEEAQKLGLRLGTLDEEVDKRRPNEEHGPEQGGQGQAIIFPTIEPWDAPVNGVELLDGIEAAYKRYVVMPDAGLAVAALWSVFTHCFEEFEHSPRLALQSPEPRCGKTSVLKITDKLARRALRADNVTAAALFRMIERHSPTVLVDEADAFAKENEELRGIINSGHERGGGVIRTVGDDHEPRRFATWGPMLIAGIGGLAATIEDRSIIIKLKRKTREEQVERLRSNKCDRLHILRRKIARFAQDHKQDLHDADPAIPDELGDRGADNWRPLFAIADAAGGRWPQRARNAAIALSSEGSASTQSSRLKLLVDIREIFVSRQVKEIASSALASALAAMLDRPWGEWCRGKPITPKRVADFLAEFSIHPRKLKTGTRPNGYEFSQFEDPFKRYLDRPRSSFAPETPARCSRA